jgi:hypothetical protein
VESDDLKFRVVESGEWRVVESDDLKFRVESSCVPMVASDQRSSVEWRVARKFKVPPLAEFNFLLYTVCEATLL